MSDRAVTRDLLTSRFDALYVTQDGRLVHTNEWDHRPAPRFHLMKTAHGPFVRFRGDVPAPLARRLEDLARSVPWDPASPSEVSARARYLELLAAHAPVRSEWSGPGYACLSEPPPAQATVSIGRDNADLLRGRFNDWLADIPYRRPFVASVEDGRAVSICASVRISPAVHCAGVETHADHRRRGHAVTAVSGWARAVRALGATPFYSTSWDNQASQAVAGRLGFELVATDFHIT